MSNVNNDTSALDEKKKKEANNAASDYGAKLKKFTTSFMTAFYVVLLYFSCSGVALMLCKVAQSNLLPTDPRCSPYTEEKVVLPSVKSNIFTTGVFTDPEMSMKLVFSTTLEKNFTYRILDAIREYKASPSSNFLANYFISIVEGLVQMNFSIINTVMNQVNGFPEVVIVSLGPLINAILFGIGMVVNFFYFIYLYFANMYWFFKQNANDTSEDSNDKPQWQVVTFASPVDWGMAVALVVLFVFLFIIFLPILGFVPLVILVYCILSTLSFKGQLNDNRSISIAGIVTGVIVHYKLTIVTILSLVMISLAFSGLGTMQGIIAIIIACCIYYGLIRFDTFSPINETHLTPLVRNDQPEKSCRPTRAKNISLDEMMFGGGKHLSQHLRHRFKKLLKQLN